MSPVPPGRASPALLLQRHRERFGEAGGAPRLFQAPGRINLIGEHTDYSGGLVLPAAIDRRCFVAARATGEGRLRVLATDLSEEAEADLSQLRPRGGWFDYVQGVAAALRRVGIPISGADLAIASDVPVGSGVSSSAALEVALVHALLGLAGARRDGLSIARLAQAAETDFVGMPCGVMDQFASAMGKAGAALLLDCRSLEADPRPIPETAAFFLVDSTVRHAHVGGGYGERRRECEAAAAALGVPSLREAESLNVDGFADRLPEPLDRRARHVVLENRRVRLAADALAAGALADLGALMSASHASLRDDFEVSDPKVDRLQALAADTDGVLGARMMGGGFGGSVIVLCRASEAAHARQAIVEAFAREVGEPPDSLVCVVSGGAGEVGQ